MMEELSRQLPKADASNNLSLPCVRMTYYESRIRPIGADMSAKIELKPIFVVKVKLLLCERLMNSFSGPNKPICKLQQHQIMKYHPGVRVFCGIDAVRENGQNIE